MSRALLLLIIVITVCGCQCEPGPIVEELGKIQEVEYKIEPDEESMFVTAGGTQFYIAETALPGADEGSDAKIRKLKNCPSRSFLLCTNGGCAKIWKSVETDTTSNEKLEISK